MLKSFLSSLESSKEIPNMPVAPPPCPPPQQSYVGSFLRVECRSAGRSQRFVPPWEERPGSFRIPPQDKRRPVLGWWWSVFGGRASPEQIIEGSLALEEDRSLLAREPRGGEQSVLLQNEVFQFVR